MLEANIQILHCYKYHLMTFSYSATRREKKLSLELHNIKVVIKSTGEENGEKTIWMIAAFFSALWCAVYADTDNYQLNSNCLWYLVVFASCGFMSNQIIQETILRPYYDESVYLQHN